MRGQTAGQAGQTAGEHADAAVDEPVVIQRERR